MVVLQKKCKMNPLRFLVLIASFSLTCNQLLAQEKHFNGTWTMIGTTYVFEFDLFLKHDQNNNVAGHFDWKVTKYDENSVDSKSYYEPKLGSTAKEFVRGTFNPNTKEYFLKGYKKEDPHLIISTDSYRLKIDENGDIGGDSKAHNTWKGRINGNAVKNDLALKFLIIKAPLNQLAVAINPENDFAVVVN